MEAIRQRAIGEARGRRAADSSRSLVSLVACLSLGDRSNAERLVREEQTLLSGSGALHLLAKRGDVPAVQWLLERGADPNARWMHWDAEVTALHLTAFCGSVEVARLLLSAGADPTIRDGKHESDAIGWAEHFGRVELRRLLEAGTAR
jgi:ankyrin repeat protein